MLEAHTCFPAQFQRKTAPDYPSLLCHNINQINAENESARAQNRIIMYEIKILKQQKRLLKLKHPFVTIIVQRKHKEVHPPSLNDHYLIILDNTV